MREDALGREPEYYLKELRERAGFTFQFLQVAMMSEDEMAPQMQRLAEKGRWVTP
jgi:hypothetical protein